MASDRDRAVDCPTATAPPCIGISWPAGDECCAYVDENNPPIWHFTSSAAPARRQGCHGHDGGAILIGSWGIGAPVQEGLPLVLPTGVVSMSVWVSHYLHRFHSSCFYPSELKGDAWVVGVVP
jgi:hypothetical protein